MRDSDASAGRLLLTALPAAGTFCGGTLNDRRWCQHLLLHRLCVSCYNCNKVFLVLLMLAMAVLGLLLLLLGCSVYR